MKMCVFSALLKDSKAERFTATYPKLFVAIVHNHLIKIKFQLHKIFFSIIFFPDRSTSSESNCASGPQVTAHQTILEKAAGNKSI